MITLAKLSLSPLVNIQVNLSAKSAARKGFNVALIMGSSKVIPKEERVRIYTGAEAMLEDGFTIESPEYKAALLYFSSRLAPTKLAWQMQMTGVSSLLPKHAVRQIPSGMF